MRRFARGSERCSVSLTTKEKSRRGVDFPSTALQIVDSQGTRRQDYPWHDAALQAYHDEISRRLADDWRLLIDDVPIEPPTPPHYTPLPELEAAVVDEPDNEAAWSVLGDAWAHHDDPRGECILLSRGASSTDPAEFMRRRAAMLPMTRRRNGLVFVELGADAYRVSAKFIGGLIDVVELHDEHLAPGQPTSALLAKLLANPFARFLSVLSFEATHVAASLEVLATVGAPALRALRVRQLDERSSVPVRVGPASAQLGRLRRLALRLEHAPIDWTDATFPMLAELELEQPGSPAQCDELVAWISSHPAIEKVTIGPGLDGHDTDQIIQRLDAWIANVARWPRSLREVSWNHRVARR